MWFWASSKKIAEDAEDALEAECVDAETLPASGSTGPSDQEHLGGVPQRGPHGIEGDADGVHQPGTPGIEEDVGGVPQPDASEEDSGGAPQRGPHGTEEGSDGVPQPGTPGIEEDGGGVPQPDAREEDTGGVPQRGPHGIEKDAGGGPRPGPIQVGGDSLRKPSRQKQKENDDMQALEDAINAAKDVISHGNVRINADESIELIKFGNNQIPFEPCKFDIGHQTFAQCFQILSACKPQAAIQTRYSDEVEETMADIVELGKILGMTDLQVVGQAAINDELTAFAKGHIREWKAASTKLAAARASLLVDLIVKRFDGTSLPQPVLDLKNKMAQCVGSEVQDVSSKCSEVTLVAKGAIGVKIKMRSAVNVDAL